VSRLTQADISTLLPENSPASVGPG
jgi:hypothetical protein